MGERRPFWVSWWHRDVGFTWAGPWWISAVRADDADAVCAAVMALDEDDARARIAAAHEDPEALIEWRFDHCDACDLRLALRSTP